MASSDASGQVNLNTGLWLTSTPERPYFVDVSSVR